MSKIHQEHWFEQAQKQVQIEDDEQVAIDRFGEIFHKNKWDHYLGKMELWNVEDAVYGTPRPCSRCFPTLYSFYQTQRRMELQNGF